MSEPSWLQSHPHIMRFAYVAVVLASIAFAVATFGRETVKVWVEGGARSLGYEITAIPEATPEAEEGEVK